MAKPVNFTESDSVLGPPEGMADSVVPLPVHRSRAGFMSCWELTDREIEEIIETRRVWLHVMGQHPPVYVSGHDPFNPESDSHVFVAEPRGNA